MAWKYGEYNYNPTEIKKVITKRAKKSNQKTMKSLAPYKNPIFGTHKETVTLMTKGGRTKKVEVDVQDVELERLIRKTQRAYGQYSNEMKKITGKGEGKARQSKAKKIYKQEGREGVKRWANILYAKARGLATEENSQDLFQAVATVSGSYSGLWDYVEDIYGSGTVFDSLSDYDSALDSLHTYIGGGNMTYEEKERLIENLYDARFQPVYDPKDNESDYVSDGLWQWRSFVGLIYRA